MHQTTSPDDLQPLYERAKQIHQNGDLTGACALYDQILAKVPKHPGAVHYRGLAEVQQNQPAGLERMRRACELAPGNRDFLSNYRKAEQLLERRGISLNAGINNGLDTNKNSANANPTLAIDGTIFQQIQSADAMIWQSVLQHFVTTAFGRHVVVFETGRAVPQIQGLRYLELPAPPDMTAANRCQLLDHACSHVNASLFATTDLVTPTNTPVVHIHHRQHHDLLSLPFSEQARLRENFHLIFSEATDPEFSAEFSAMQGITTDRILLTPPASLTTGFSPVAPDQLSHFQQRHALHQPYVLMAMTPASDTHVLAFTQALALFEQEQASALKLVIMASDSTCDNAAYMPSGTFQSLDLAPAEHPLAYTGAFALYVPDQAESSVKPAMQAMACGCPVIANGQGSLAEIAADAAILVDCDNPILIADILKRLQAPAMRNAVREQSLAQARELTARALAGRLEGLFRRQLGMTRTAPAP